MTIHDFDDIRPFEPEELPAVYDRLTADPQFRQVVQAVFPQAPFEALEQKMRQCATSLDFQKAFCYGFLKQLLAKASTGCDIDATSIDNTRRYTFVSNHRDIVLDSALLDVMLIDAGFATTCEIAIGDNLLAAPWIKDLVRLNKSFIVERGVSIREMLAKSQHLSQYMHFAISEKHENIWIAQREGRAKDSDDRTQPSVLKMMAMGGEGSPAQRLKQLHIVPLAISYEYDPCDYLKAQEFQLKRDVEGWRKSKADDVMSMKTGIMGYKGRIHYHCAPCIDQWLDTLPGDMSKQDFYDAVAQHIDKEIHSRYMLYPANYVALDMLDNSDRHASQYTPEQKAQFCKYLEGQLAKTSGLEHPDTDFLRERMLRMYANPAINQLNTKREN